MMTIREIADHLGLDLITINSPAASSGVLQTFRHAELDKPAPYLIRGHPVRSSLDTGFRRYDGFAASRGVLDLKQIKDIHKEALKNRYEEEDIGYPVLLAVDEISVKKRHRYLTMIINWETGRVLFVGQRRSYNTLKDFFRSLTEKLADGDTGCCHGYVGSVHQGGDKILSSCCHRFRPISRGEFLRQGHRQSSK